MNRPDEAGESEPVGGAPDADRPAVARGSLAWRPPAESGSTPARPSGPPRSPWLVAVIAFALALVVCLATYLATAVPDRWFPSAPTLAWPARALGLGRGTQAELVGTELVVTGAAEDVPTAVVSINSDFAAADYNAIVWGALDFPPDATVHLVWRTDVEPARVNSIALGIVSGRLQAITMRGQPRWVGRIKGLALAIRAPLAQPVRIRGVVAKPLGAVETLRDRLAEWTAYEGWHGTSINSVTGGSDLQDLPMPLLVAVSLLVAGAGIVAFVRWRPGRVAHPRLALVALLVLGWLSLDLRWSANLVRQAAATARQFAGRDDDARVLAEDGDLAAFVRRAKAVMPAEPARVFVVSDAYYFRGRGAWHLLPHRAYSTPTLDAMPPASALRPGDWLLVYQRRGVQYDPSRKVLRWEGGQGVDAELKLAGQGAALFEVR